MKKLASLIFLFSISTAVQAFEINAVNESLVFTGSDVDSNVTAVAKNFQFPLSYTPPPMRTFLGTIQLGPIQVPANTQATGNRKTRVSLRNFQIVYDKLELTYSVKTLCSEMVPNIQVIGPIQANMDVAGQVLCVPGRENLNIQVNLEELLPVFVKKGDGQTLNVKIAENYLDETILPAITLAVRNQLDATLPETPAEPNENEYRGFNMNTDFAQRCSANSRQCFVNEMSKMAHVKAQMVEQGPALAAQALRNGVATIPAQQQAIDGLINWTEGYLTRTGEDPNPWILGVPDQE